MADFGKMASQCRELDAPVAFSLDSTALFFCRRAEVHRHDIWRAFRGAENCGDAKTVKVPSIHRLNAVGRPRGERHGTGPRGERVHRSGDTPAFRGSRSASGARPVSRWRGKGKDCCCCCWGGGRISALNMFCSCRTFRL